MHHHNILNYTDLHTPRETRRRYAGPYHGHPDHYEADAWTPDPMSPKQMHTRMWVIWSQFWDLPSGRNTIVHPPVSLARNLGVPTTISLQVDPPAWLHVIPFYTERQRPDFVVSRAPWRLDGRTPTDSWLCWNLAWISTVEDVVALNYLDLFSDRENAQEHRDSIEGALRQFLRFVNADGSEHLPQIRPVPWTLEVDLTEAELAQLIDLSAWYVVNAMTELLTRPMPFPLDNDFPRVPYRTALDVKLLDAFMSDVALAVQIAQEQGADANRDRGNQAFEDGIELDDIVAQRIQLGRDPSEYTHRYCRVCRGRSAIVDRGALQQCDICNMRCHERCKINPRTFGIQLGQNRQGFQVWLCFDCRLNANPPPLPAVQPAAPVPQEAEPIVPEGPPPRVIRRRRRHEAEPPPERPICQWMECRSAILNDQPAIMCNCSQQFHVECALKADGLPVHEIRNRLLIWARDKSQLSAQDLVLQRWYEQEWQCLTCKNTHEREFVMNRIPPVVQQIRPYVDHGRKRLCVRCGHGLLYPWELEESDRLCCGTMNKPIHFSVEAHEASIPEELAELNARYPGLLTKFSRQINSMVSIASVGCHKLRRGRQPHNHHELVIETTGGIHQELNRNTLVAGGHIEVNGVIAHFEIADRGGRSNCLVGNILSYVFPEPSTDEIRNLSWPVPAANNQGERVYLPDAVAEIVTVCRNIFRTRNRFFPRVLGYVDIEATRHRAGREGSVVNVLGPDEVPPFAIPRIVWGTDLENIQERSLRTSYIAYVAEDSTQNRPIVEGRVGRRTRLTFFHTHPWYDTFIYPLLDLQGLASFAHGNNIGPDVYERQGQSIYDNLNLPPIRVDWMKHLRARVFQLKSHRVCRDIADQYVLDRVSMHNQATAFNNEFHATAGLIQGNEPPMEPEAEPGEDGAQPPEQRLAHNNVNDNRHARQGERRPLRYYDPIRRLRKVHHTVRGSFQERIYHIEQGSELVTHFGHPTLFITMTAGEWWPEFREEMQRESVAVQNMLDLVRVFGHKVETLLEGLKDGRYFGHRATFVQAKIEFQKRGKPHVHILAKLEDCDHLLPEEVDKMVSAELPRCPNVDSYDADPDAGCLDDRNFPGRCLVCPLRRKVRKYMTHKHYAERCQKKKPDWAAKRGEPPRLAQEINKCELGFPFRLQSETEFGECGRWLYRRTPGSEMIVPYSPQLISEFDCHINTEVSTGTRSVLYLQKYFAKTHDTIDLKAIFAPGANQRDQLVQFFLLRYMCIAEAYWQLLGLPFVYFYPKVSSIYVFPKFLATDQDNLYDVGEGNRGQAGPAVADSLVKDLRMYFCRPAHLKDLNIVDFYANYGVKAMSSEELERPDFPIRSRLLPPAAEYKIVTHQTKHVVCFRFLDMKRMEQFSFVLLLKDKPCRSLREVRTVGNTEYRSYELACKACGIFEEDPLGSYRKLFVEMSLRQRPVEDFLLAAKTLLLDSVEVFLEFFEAQSMYKYLLHDWELEGGPIRPENQVLQTEEDRKNRALMRFSRYCFGENIPIFDILHQHRANHSVVTRLEHLMTEAERFECLRAQFVHDEANDTTRGIQLTAEQQSVFETIQISFREWAHERQQQDRAPQAIRNHVHYINGMAGTGKTTLLRKLHRYFREEYPEGVAGSAYTGTAALQLPKGRTCHSMYSIPIIAQANPAPRDDDIVEPGDETTTAITDTRLRLLSTLKVHIIDEVSLLSAQQLDHIEYTLRKATTYSETAPIGAARAPFGGSFVVFGGDFHQAAPIVEGLSKEVRRNDTSVSAAVLNATILTNRHFMDCTHHRLAFPMRFTGNFLETFIPFATEVAKGNCGTVFEADNPEVSAHFAIRLNQFPAFFHSQFRSSMEEALREIPEERRNDPIQLLAPHHQAVQRFNRMTYEENKERGRVLGEAERIYDATYCEAKSLRPGTYYDPSSTPNLTRFAAVDNARDPPHTLKLCPGVPIMLLRNLSLDQGLTNGAIFTVTEVHRNFIRARSVDTGKEVLIFRLRLTLTCGLWQFKRIQFPVRLAYAITINKAQGKTLSGLTIIHLQEQCFAHGQLYVALSRTRNPENVRIVTRINRGETEAYVTNFVFKNVLAQAGLL